VAESARPTCRDSSGFDGMYIYMDKPSVFGSSEVERYGRDGNG